MFRWLTDSYGYDIRESADLMKTPVDNVIKFTVYHPSACEEMCAPVFTPTWQSRAKLASAGKEWVDCNPLGVNKGSAIRFLQEYLGIAPDETCCFQCKRGSHCRCKGYLCALLGKRSVAGVENFFINSPGHSESKRLTLLR